MTKHTKKLLRHTVIAILTSCTMLAYGTMKAALHMHHTLMNSIMRAPQHFFDTTPKGRILARFHSDLNTLDYQLPMSLRQIINVFFRVGAKKLYLIRKLTSTRVTINLNYILINDWLAFTCVLLQKYDGSDFFLKRKLTSEMQLKKTIGDNRISRTPSINFS